MIGLATIFVIVMVFILALLVAAFPIAVLVLVIQDYENYKAKCIEDGTWFSPQQLALRARVW